MFRNLKKDGKINSTRIRNCQVFNRTKGTREVAKIYDVKIYCINCKVFIRTMGTPEVAKIYCVKIYRINIQYKL